MDFRIWTTHVEGQALARGKVRRDALKILIGQVGTKAGNGGICDGVEADLPAVMTRSPPAETPNRPPSRRFPLRYFIRNRSSS